MASWTAMILTEGLASRPLIFHPSVLASTLAATLGPLFSSKYLPHRFCYLAEPGLIWTNAIADSLIAVSYCVIFFCLARLVAAWRRVTELKSFLWVFASFGAFILACGTTHLMDVITVWIPVYPLSATFKVVCALVSVPTAIVFAQRTPAISHKFSHYLDLISTERQESIEALRKTEALLERTGRLAGVGGWELEVDSRKLTWSAEMFRIFGFSPEHQPSLSETLSFYTPESRELVLSAIARAREEGIGWSLELETRRLNGQPINVRCVGALERTPGSKVRINGALQDITAQVERQKALRKTEVLLDRTGRLAGVGGWELDLKTHVLTWSAENCRILGAPEDFRPNLQQAMDMYVPGSRERLISAYEKACVSGTGWEMELEVDRMDGRRIWVRLLGAVEVEDGRPRRLNGATQDITAQVARQEDLRRANERIALATDSGRIGIWDWEIQENVLTWDAWTFRLYGMEPDTETASYALWAKHLHPDDAADAEASIARVLIDGAQLNMEFRIFWPDGSIHAIHFSGRVTRDQAGRSIRMVGANWDITAQREITIEKERLMMAELKMRDEFLSRVSHELRSPLTSIYSFTSIVADGLAGVTTPEQQDYLGIVLKNSAQLQAMIEDLLSVSSSMKGKLAIAPQYILCSEAIGDSLQALQGAATAKGIAMTIQGCDDLPMVYADPARLRQILSILLDNAVKFTPHGGRVDIKAITGRADALLIEVSDTGCGIPRGDIVKVFEHHYQVGASDNNGRSGLGLGLHIARSLVVRQGGKIWVTSEEGKGSVVSFTVPTQPGHLVKSDQKDTGGAVDDVLGFQLVAQ